jgi:DNA-binding CsgD family transcriptional regulator
MDHLRIVATSLDLMLEARAGEVVTDLGDRPDSTAQSMVAMSHFWLGRFDAAERSAHAALSRTQSAAERGLALAALALAEAGLTTSEPSAALDEAVSSLGPSRDAMDDFVRYLVAEAALTQARIGVAEAVWDDSVPESWRGHSYRAMMLATGSRIAAFGGRIDEAQGRAQQAMAEADGGRARLLTKAVAGLASGNGSDFTATRSLVDEIEGAGLAADDHLGRGVHLLAAFGAVAIGDVERSAALVLTAGGDEGLTHFVVIDRALGLELLVAAAVATGDRDAAEAWGAQAEPLVDHPIARPTIQRLKARLAEMAGDHDRAIMLAEQAVEGCRRDARNVELAETEVVLARLRVAGNDVSTATRSMRELVAESDRLGYHAVRREAGRTLGRAGRRLPPVVGNGWGALSARETEIAGLILEGRETSQIARLLFISPHTVRVHTSRVLAAFGVGTRVQLLARAGEPSEGARARAGQALTPRQREVVTLVAEGLSNAEVADRLGVTVKAVEKHVSAALRRSGARSRLDLVRGQTSDSVELVVGEGEELAPEVFER